MVNIKSFFFRINCIIYSPIFPVLLTTIVFISYKIYFEPTLLCDGNDITLAENNNNNNEIQYPFHKRVEQLRLSEKVYDPLQDFDFVNRELKIARYKKEFIEFYTSNKESIKFTQDELDKLTIKVANKYINKGCLTEVIVMLPKNIQPLYIKYTRNELFKKIRFSSTK